MEISIRIPDTRCLISSCKIPANSLSSLLSFGEGDLERLGGEISNEISNAQRCETHFCCSPIDPQPRRGGVGWAEATQSHVSQEDTMMIHRQRAAAVALRSARVCRC